MQLKISATFVLYYTKFLFLLVIYNDDFDDFLFLDMFVILFSQLSYLQIKRFRTTVREKCIENINMLEQIHVFLRF